MFVLVTGTPGSGKTSSVIARFVNEKKRPIYYRGIRDLTLPWHELTDDEARDWPNHVPHGAILIVDEAQQLWPVRPSTRPVPDALTQLETHRHFGWDVWFITQEPSLLDSHARKVANEHYHYVRAFGAPFITEYHSGTGAVSVSSRTDLARCAQKRKRLPKSAWGHYKSAEEHTHKFRPPKMLYVLGLLLLAAPFVWWNFFANFGENVSSAEISGAEENSTLSGSLAAARGEPERKSWAELLAPEVQGIPWTAPLYAERARSVAQVPRIAACMHPPKNPRMCVCYTQQGTKIFDMPWQMCAAFVRDGMFNHMAPDAISSELAEADAGGPAAHDEQRLARANATFLPDYTPRPSRRIN